MLIKVLVREGEEELFNADCQIAYLLDAIKQKLGIQRKEEIELCTENAELKHLNTHTLENGASFFKTRESCIALIVTAVDGQSLYTPANPEYATNEPFLGLLNCKDEPEPEVEASPLPRGRSRKISTRSYSLSGVQGSPTRVKSGSGSKAEQNSKKKRRRTVAKIN